MSRIKLLLLLPIVFGLITESCKKNGVIGPQGGTGNNSPVDTIRTTTYSPWYTPTSYTKDTTPGIDQFYTNMPASNITQDTLKKDTILVFSKLDGYNPILYPSNLVSLMPVIVNYSEGSTMYTDSWSARVTTGNIQIIFIDNRNNSAGLYYAHKFRYLIVPKGTR